MMTDRELLELAAKAADIVAMPVYDYETKIASEALYLSNAKEWNPLTGDGDAFRLAVALQLDITFINSDVVVLNVSEGGGCDQYAQARRAIVRAAAEIGKEMP